jgi:hypothetical protein
MKRRITITVYDDSIADDKAIEKVWQVIRGGRISYGNRYCLASVWNGDIAVYADKSRTGQDVFRVFKERS